jgi:DNA helicase HerA-like ATPase
MIHACEEGYIISLACLLNWSQKLLLNIWSENPNRTRFPLSVDSIIWFQLVVEIRVKLLDADTEPETLRDHIANAEFGMRRTPKAFKGRVIDSDPQPDALLASKGVTIIDLSETYDAGERVKKVARMLDELLEYFQFQEDAEDLRLLIVVEEAHLWTSKDVPKDAARFLDSAVRLLRKKGVGVMLVSQKVSDFDPAMRSAMNISILFRTKYEGDLRAIARMLGSDASTIMPGLPVGYSVFHLADVGDPFVLAWRPTYSQP